MRIRPIVFVAVLALLTSVVTAGPIVLILVDSLSVTPPVPKANEPAEITIQAFNSGCWNNQSASVSGYVVEINLDIFFCGPNLDPFPTPTFTFQVPGLPSGQYTVEVFANTEVDAVNPIFTTGFAVEPIVVPTLNTFGLVALCLFVLGAVCLKPRTVREN
ncbi:MAG: hypothetical protein AAF978_05255 [Cyanobacteria bacterium P01_E01_bin.48]